ncbi:MAG: SPASM domain-containing protein [Burkholderiales bacterium]|nr:SPASM domain-containing protein [Burkholderiales bacterium]
MESIYYVMAWACHRKCRHCYEDRFRPYVRGELEAVVQEAERNFPRIVANLPERLTYRDLDDPRPDGTFPEKTARVILSGGESLLDPVRERVTYQVIDALREKYAAQGGVKVVVQTTGDLLTDAIVADLLRRGVWMISVASVDDFHVGLEGPAKQQAFMGKLSALFERHGMRQSGLSATTRNWHEEPGPLYSFFGATPDSWIGKLWPRGRAWQNNLSQATLADNFCNRWSGGLNFLRHEFNGSEVSIEPDGAVYPCCVKTKLPLGSLLEDNLIEILESLAGVPAYEAITMGHPERMGIASGWSEQDFLAHSRTQRPDGAGYANLCIGCDRFHEQMLGPVLDEARQRRRAAKGLADGTAAPRRVVAIAPRER